MARTLSVTVSENYADMRLDSFLFESGLYPSRSKAVKQIESGKVFVNGNEQPKKPSLLLTTLLFMRNTQKNSVSFLNLKTFL